MANCDLGCGRPVVGAYVCWPDTHRTGHILDTLAALLGELADTITRQTAGRRDTGRSMAVDPPLPFDAVASERQRDITRPVVRWAKYCAQRFKHDAPTAPTAAARYLRAHLSRIRGLAAASEAFRDLAAAERLLVATIDTKPDRRYLGPCWAPLVDGTECPARLYAYPDAGYTHCRACGTSWDVGARDAQLEAAIRETRYTIAMTRRHLAATIGPIPLSTVRSWIRRGLTTEHDEEGRITIRFGDALDRAVETLQRRAARDAAATAKRSAKRRKNLGLPGDLTINMRSCTLVHAWARVCPQTGARSVDLKRPGSHEEPDRSTSGKARPRPARRPPTTAARRHAVDGAGQAAQADPPAP